jgi:DNA-binding MarR family transcriptional regulator
VQRLQEERKEIRKTTGHLLARVSKAHRSRVGQELAELGLHPGQEMVLAELWREDGLRVCELAGRLGVEPPTATRMLQRLERCGFVERRRDPEDARSFRVFLTARGRCLEERVFRCWEQVEQEAFAGISRQEVETLRDLLGRVRSNLEEGRQKLGSRS